MANKPGEANFFPDVPEFPSMGVFQPIYGKFDLTTYIQGASDYEIMAFLVGKYNACLEAYGNITKLSTDTITACKQLQDWINSWFTNLDVQEEINKKLDKMVADGSFGTLLHQTFDAQINQQTTSTVTAWLVANVTPTGSAVVVDKSLSIKGAAADAKAVGDKLNNFMWGGTTDIVFNVSATSTEYTFNWDSGVAVMNEHFYILRSDMKTTSISFTTNVGGDTVAITIDANRNLNVYRIGSYKYNANEYIIALIYAVDGTASFVWKPYTLPDKTLTINNAPADAKTVGDFMPNFMWGSTDDVVFSTGIASSTEYLFSWDAGLALMNEHMYILRNMMKATSISFTAETAGQTYIVTVDTSYNLHAYKIKEYKFKKTEFIIAIIYANNGTSRFVWKPYIKPDTTLTKSGIPADAKTVGDKISAISDNYNIKDTCFGSINEFVAIGDSLTVGYTGKADGTIIDPDYNHSWCSYIQKKYGVTPYWSAYSGITTALWLENKSQSGTSISVGSDYVKQLGAKPLYFISLITNDANTNPDWGLTLGTESDIGTDNRTFYGCYDKIIRVVQSVSPNAIIICTGSPQGLTGGNYPAYEAAIKTIVSKHNKTYYADATKLINDNIPSSLATAGHWTTVGYARLANVYAYLINKIINDNISVCKFIADTELTKNPT